MPLIKAVLCLLRHVESPTRQKSAENDQQSYTISPTRLRILSPALRLPDLTSRLPCQAPMQMRGIKEENSDIDNFHGKGGAGTEKRPGEIGFNILGSDCSTSSCVSEDDS